MYLSFRDFDSSLLARPAEGNEDIRRSVEDVIGNVRRRGDAALREYAERFDSSSLDSLYASDREFEEAERNVPEDLKEAIRHAMRNIRKFHEAQIPEGEDIETESGVRCPRLSHTAIMPTSCLYPLTLSPPFLIMIRLFSGDFNHLRNKYATFDQIHQ